MIKPTKARGFLLFLAILFVSMTSLTLVSCQKKGEIAIGAVFPLSGDAQRIGSMKKDGAELAVDMINVRGGIKGRKLVVLYEDSQNEASVGLSAFTKLADVDKVPVVMSAMSGVSMPLAPVAEEKSVVLFANVGHPAMTEQNEWTFRDFPTAAQEARVIVNFAITELDAKKAAILYPNDDWGLSGREAFKQEFAAQGGEIVADESYEKTDTDFRTQLTKIKAANPDVIYFTGFGNALGIIAKQSVEIGIEAHRLTTTGFNDKAIIELAGDAAEGVYLTTSAFDPDSRDTTVVKFVAAFEEKFGRKPAFDEALQYDTVMLIALAMEKGGFTSEGIRKALAEIENYHGVIGMTSVTSEGDFETPIILKVIKEGQVTEK